MRRVHAGHLVALGKLREPRHPAAPPRLLHDEQARPLEGVLDRADRARRVARELVVALAQQPEGVVVEAQPDVQAVLLDALMRAAPAGALAAESPAELVDGDALVPLLPARPAQLH